MGRVTTTQCSCGTGEENARPSTRCSWGTGEENARPSTRCSWGTGEENARPSTRCSWGTGEENARLSTRCSRGTGRRMRGPRPGAPEGPGRMCSPRLAHPGPHWRPRMEQGIKTDHPWIYLNNNKLYENRINTLLCTFMSVL